MVTEDEIDPIVFAIYAARVELARPEKAEPGARPSMDEDLALLFKDLAELHLPQLPVPAGALASDYEGYIEFETIGFRVFLPFHLVESFPSANTLDDLLCFARSVQLSADDAICLSGSATFSGALATVGDLDFCEYVTLPETAVAESVQEKVTATWDDLVCVNLRRGSTSLARPWPAQGIKAWLLESTAKPALGPPDSTREWKVDFVGLSTALGPLPISNLGLPFDPADPEGGLADRSWTYQEAVLTRNVRPPRSMALPERFGSYILWLREQIAKYENERPVKALKRALSLARVMRLRTEAEDLLEALNSPIIARSAANLALDEAERLLGQPNCPTSRRIQEGIGLARAKRSTAVSDSGADTAIGSILARVRARVDSLLEEARLLLETEAL